MVIRAEERNIILKSKQLFLFGFVVSDFPHRNIKGGYCPELNMDFQTCLKSHHKLT